MTWRPEQYVLGNYFQTQINELFRQQKGLKLWGSILDVGCGDGQYSHFLAQHYRKSTLLGIDSSEEMIVHAQECWTRNNLSFVATRIEDLQQTEAFDFILSFWCLHWADTEVSLANIFKALKSGGTFYAVISSLSDHSVLQTWQELAKKDKYRELATRLVAAGTTRQNYFYYVLNCLLRLSFKEVKLDLKTVRVLLPSMEYFEHLINTLPFVHHVPEEERNEFRQAMIHAFATICQRKYENQLYYETRPIFLEAHK